MNEQKPRNYKKPGKSYGKSTKPGNSTKPNKFSKSGKQSGFKKLQGKKGAQQGDYIIISDGKKKVTTRINLSSHPFAKKEIGDVVSIKGVQWYLIKIIHQGTAAYNAIYDADTQREHFGY